MIATGVRDSNLKDQATVKHEFDLIGGSLLLSFAIGPLLSPQTTCADGSECPVILALDMLCWATLSTCLLLCVVSSWSMVAIEQCVSTEAMARWAYENWPFYNMGAGLMVTSFTFLPFALATRSVILLHGNPAYPAWLVWIVMAILLGGGIVMQYVVDHHLLPHVLPFRPLPISSPSTSVSSASACRRRSSSARPFR